MMNPFYPNGNDLFQDENVPIHRAQELIYGLCEKANVVAFADIRHRI